MNLSVFHITESHPVINAAISVCKISTDPFRVLKGLSEAKKLIRELKPDIIFSKGGFVSVPVVLAGKKNKVPVIIHESDMTPGLANKLAIPSATKVCCNFPETMNYLPDRKSCAYRFSDPSGTFNRKSHHCTGLMWIYRGQTGYPRNRRKLGSVAVNTAVRAALPELLKTFQIIHLCGKGKLDESLIISRATPSLNISKKS